MLKYGLMTGMLVTFLAVLSGCVPPPEGAEEGGGFDWTLIIFIVLLVAIFYFLIIRPKTQQEKKHRERLEQIRKGDEVVTAGGIVGEVVHLKDDKVTIKSGESRLVVQRGRIAEVMVPGQSSESRK